MSYLNVPRLVFAGQFQADPSTINNVAEHFDSQNFRSNYQLPGPANGWWNPRGTGAWRFRGVVVRQVVYRDGTSCDEAKQDPIIGAPVNDADSYVEGKLVDLDPEQQMVSEIWGFRVLVGRPRNSFGFRSEFQVAPFADMWKRFGQGTPDSCFSAFYQSVLQPIDWAGAGGSRFLNDLCAAGQPPRKLSIKFNADGFDDNRDSPTFTFGRVVGTIGPYVPGEPSRFVAGRVLEPLGDSASLNTAYAQVDGDMLSLDLGNSLPTQSPGGPLVDLGPLSVAFVPPGNDPVVIGEIGYRDKNWYEQTAGLVTWRLTPGQVQQAGNTPLAVVQTSAQGVLPLISENPSGTFARADDFVFRLNPGDKAVTVYYATTFGRRAAGQKISLGYDATIMTMQAGQGPLAGPQVVGLPTSALTFPPSIITRKDGTAELPLEASDPGCPRGYIDGQVYGVSYALGDSPPAAGSVWNSSRLVNVLVWSVFKAPERPTWLRDVRPILQQYANLYPVMRPIVDLDNYASLIAKRTILKNVLDAPVSDPNYMPVTRDLSAAKRAMIRRWLDRPHYMRLDSVQDLLTALQQAIELEHSTIPPYLCALYSIKPGANVEVAELIRSVVIEEMLHMALIANLLVSVGGSPRMGHPGFVPRYPGPLPGGLRGGLTVRLRRCSIAQIRDVFMAIEEPEETVETVSGRDEPGDPIDVHRFTIGWFYDEIERSLVKLSRAGRISFGHADRQVSSWHGTGRLYVISNLRQARAAIREIKCQGEGASLFDPDDKDHELAHYYKFSEIVAGRRIVVDRKGFSYTGDAVPFDPDGLWPMMDDPDIALLAPGSRARILSEQFAETYQALLNGLERTFNGEPAFMSQVFGLMYSLGLAARQLVETPSGLGDGTTAGPSFQIPSSS